VAEYTIKELLEQFVIPEQREIKRLLESKADRASVEELRVDVERLEQQFQEFQRVALSPEKVGSLIGDALRERRARGWTTWEHWRLVLITAATLMTLAFTAFNFFR